MPSKPRRARTTRPANAGAARVSSVQGGAPAQERELRAQGRKTMRRLLEAGRFVFERRGFHSARVDDIVKVAKTSHGTFYLYFSNKEDLFKALAFDAMAEMATLVDELGPITPDDDGYAALRSWVARFCETYAAHGNIIRGWSEGQMVDKELVGEGHNLLLRLSSAIGRRIAESGHSTDPEAAGLACLSMLERFNYFVQANQVDYDREAIVDTLTSAAFAGFFAPRPRAAVRGDGVGGRARATARH